MGILLSSLSWLHYSPYEKEQDHRLKYVKRQNGDGLVEIKPYMEAGRPEEESSFVGILPPDQEEQQVEEERQGQDSNKSALRYRYPF